MMLFKVLGNESPYEIEKAIWNFPTKNEDGSWTPGDWMPEIHGDLVQYTNGYCLYREKDLVHGLDQEIYEAEYDGEMVEYSDYIIVRKVRLLRKFENWNEQTARQFACWCALNTPLPDGRKVGDSLTDERSNAATSNAGWDDALTFSQNTVRFAQTTDPAALAAQSTAWAAACVAADIARDAATDVQTKQLLRILEIERNH